MDKEQRQPPSSDKRALWSGRKHRWRQIDLATRSGLIWIAQRPRRTAVEPVIGHLKSDHRMDRNFLIGSHGDATNAVLAAVGYNFQRLAAWLRALLRVWLVIVLVRGTGQADEARIA